MWFFHRGCFCLAIPLMCFRAPHLGLAGIGSCCVSTRLLFVFTHEPQPSIPFPCLRKISRSFLSSWLFLCLFPPAPLFVCVLRVLNPGFFKTLLCDSSSFFSTDNSSTGSTGKQGKPGGQRQQQQARVRLAPRQSLRRGQRVRRRQRLLGLHAGVRVGLHLRLHCRRRRRRR